MCTGVRSSVVLDYLPEAEQWNEFNSDPNHQVTVTPMSDGRVHVACFSPIGQDHPDLRSELRNTAATLRSALDRLAA